MLSYATAHHTPQVSRWLDVPVQQTHKFFLRLSVRDPCENQLSISSSKGLKSKEAHSSGVVGTEHSASSPAKAAIALTAASLPRECLQSSSNNHLAEEAKVHVLMHTTSPPLSRQASIRGPYYRALLQAINLIDDLIK